MDQKNEKWRSAFLLWVYIHTISYKLAQTNYTQGELFVPKIKCCPINKIIQPNLYKFLKSIFFDLMLQVIELKRKPQGGEN